MRLWGPARASRPLKRCVGPKGATYIMFPPRRSLDQRPMTVLLAGALAVQQLEAGRVDGSATCAVLRLQARRSALATIAVMCLQAQCCGPWMLRCDRPTHVPVQQPQRRLRPQHNARAPRAASCLPAAWVGTPQAARAAQKNPSPTTSSSRGVGGRGE
eukprot:366450-Chlamydomonas_euryale.AAC.41